MKKKRYLRPWIETTLTVIFTLIFMFFAMLDDFTVNLRTVLTLLGLLTTMILDFYVLASYGKKFQKVIR